MPLQKRTIRLAGHNTSIALEPEFWAALENLAQQNGQKLPQLIAEVDSGRSGGLASALRVMVLRSNGG